MDQLELQARDLDREPVAERLGGRNEAGVPVNTPGRSPRSPSRADLLEKAAERVERAHSDRFADDAQLVLEAPRSDARALDPHPSRGDVLPRDGRLRRPSRGRRVVG